jgi:hypothetical protein
MFLFTPGLDEKNRFVLRSPGDEQDGIRISQDRHASYFTRAFPSQVSLLCKLPYLSAHA